MTDTVQTELDKLIAAAMHCKARRADPSFSYEAKAILVSVSKLMACYDFSDMIADLDANLEAYYDRHHRAYLADMEMAAAVTNYQRGAA